MKMRHVDMDSPRLATLLLSLLLVCIAGCGGPVNLPETVAPPTFTPAGNEFRGSVDITITTATAGAVIRYTLDGSTPTSSSTLYSSSIRLTTNTTIKAVGFKADFTNSAVATKIVTVVPVLTASSLATDGSQSNNQSENPALSADGRYVVFESLANNLVVNDTNDKPDVFLYDRQTGQTTRVSVASDGSQAIDGSGSPAISADGRYIVFDSLAYDLVANDTNDSLDVFLHDRQTGQTTRVSVASDGSQAFDGSGSPVISADGRYIAFQSYAENLVPGDENGSPDIFVHDRQTGLTTCVSLASDGTPTDNGSYAPAISADGRYVVFESLAANLVANDTNDSLDLFLHDRQTGQTTRVSLASDGSDSGHDDNSAPSISADGRYVAFQSGAILVDGDTNSMQDIFVHDCRTGLTTRVSLASDGTQADNGSYTPVISADGRYIAFESLATNLVLNDTNGQSDIFVHDRLTGSTTRVSLAYNLAQANGLCGAPAISSDGRHIAFESEATNLVPNDTNNAFDIFVYDRGE